MGLTFLSFWLFGASLACNLASWASFPSFWLCRPQLCHFGLVFLSFWPVGLCFQSICPFGSHFGPFRLVFFGFGACWAFVSFGLSGCILALWELLPQMPLHGLTCGLRQARQEAGAAPAEGLRDASGKIGKRQEQPPAEGLRDTPNAHGFFARASCTSLTCLGPCQGMTWAPAKVSQQDFRH